MKNKYKICIAILEISNWLVVITCVTRLIAGDFTGINGLITGIYFGCKIGAYLMFKVLKKDLEERLKEDV